MKTKEQDTMIDNYLLVKKMESGVIIPKRYYLFKPMKGKGFVLEGIS